MFGGLKKLLTAGACALGLSMTAPMATQAQQAQSVLELVFAVDESGSMGGEQEFIQTFVVDLQNSLASVGIAQSRFGLAGFGASNPEPRSFNVGSGQFGDAAALALAAQNLVTSGGFEDGYAAIDFVLKNYFATPSNATRIVLLVTDEDRDILQSASTVTFASLLQALNTQGVSLSAILDQAIADQAGTTALGTDGLLTFIDSNSDGNFEFSTAPVFGFADGTTKEDYTDLVLSTPNGCVADLNQLRNGGTNATAFSQALTACVVSQALGGTSASTFVSSVLFDGEMVSMMHQNDVFARLSRRLGGSSVLAIGTDSVVGEALLGASDDGRQSTWVEIQGGKRRVEAINSQKGSNTEALSISLGADTKIGKSILWGGSLAYVKNDSRTKGEDARSESKGILATTYVGARIGEGGRWVSGLALTGGKLDYRINRNVGGVAAVPVPIVAASTGVSAASVGSASPLATTTNVIIGKTDAEVYRGSAQIGYELDVSEHLTATPYVKGQYLQVKMDGFEEQGAGGLTYGATNFDQKEVGFGVELSGQVKGAAGGTWRPTLKVEVSEVDAKGEKVPVFLPGGRVGDSVVEGADGRVFTMGPSVAYKTSGGRFEFGASVEGRWGEEFDQVTAGVRARYVF